mgnify:CR=1 FL=1
MSFAKAFITGSVVKAPEKRFTQNDMAIAGFTINFDPANEGLIRVVAFGQLAETVSSSVNVGDMVVVEGKLQINSYKLPNGKDKKVFEINASTVEKMGGAQAPVVQQAKNENIVSFNQDEIAQDLIDEDEIPF